MCARHDGRHMRSEAAERTEHKEKKEKKRWNTSVNLTIQSTVQLWRKNTNNATHAQHLIAKVQKHQLWRGAPDEEGRNRRNKKHNESQHMLRV